MKKALALVALLTIFLGSGKTVLAGTGYGQYSTPGTQTGILIDKFVGLPKGVKGGVNYTFVDNLGTQDFRFREGHLLFFKLRVQNVSGSTINNVVITDTMPNYLQIYGDVGTVSTANKTVTISVGTLAVGETKEYQLKARVREQAPLPADKGLFCLINKAIVTSSAGSDDDTAQFCIEKQVLGAREVPKAGGELFLFSGLSTLLGYAGMKLRRIQ